MAGSDAMCPSEKEVTGWKVSTALVHILLTLILVISTAHYKSSTSMAEALQAIQVTFAKHLGEHEGLVGQHKGLVDRVKKLEEQAIINIRDR